uniref:Short-chain dehydrogenase n=1 Tax=uncultured Chloroflexota bacterium TaxID=166587 RepID=H5SER5_9CHLR|nr:short-chain dehydrogenase [uncultured Chloroflexota bacterium]
MSFPPPTPLAPHQRALIIGASSGIGEALARRLAQADYRLALLARRRERLEALCNELNTPEKRAIFYVHDVTHYEEVPDLLQRILSDLGGLDVVCYVAGVNEPPGGLDRYDFEKDRRMIEVNLLGAMAWLDAIAPLFQQAGRGHIVGISSVAGERGRVGNPAYGASKAALTSYLESLRNRLTRHGVHVLTVKPGFVQTEMLQAAQKVLFPISAARAAEEIFQALQQGKQEVYTPWFWRYIMFVIRNIPSPIFRHLSI